MVELVQIHRVEPDSIASALTRPGFHHIAYFAPNSEDEAARLAANAMPVLISLGFGDIRVHFHDALASAGYIIEHYPCVDGIEALYRKVAEAALDWDGSKPVRGPLAI